MNEVNLITPEEKFEQKTSLFFYILNISSIILFVVFASFSTYAYIQNSSLGNQKTILNNKINELKDINQGFQEEEVLLRDINLKYQSYLSIEKDRINFSEVIYEIYVRAFSTGVAVKNISFLADNEISIRVVSEADQFTRFVTRIKNTNFTDTNSRYPTLFFPSAKDEEVNQAQKEYVVYIKFKPEVVKK